MHNIQESLNRVTRQRLKPLKKGETRKERDWKDCVSQAKLLVEKHKEIRFKVIALALKVCIIHHGGSVGSGNRYTLRAFSREIGVPWGTFYEWYHISEKIYGNLDAATQKTTTYAELRHLNKAMSGQDWKSKNVVKDINKKLKKMKAKTATTIKMEKYLKNIQTIHFNAKHKLMIKDCDKAVLGEICHHARGIIYHLAKYDRKR